MNTLCKMFSKIRPSNHQKAVRNAPDYKDVTMAHMYKGFAGCTQVTIDRTWGGGKPVKGIVLPDEKPDFLESRHSIPGKIEQGARYAVYASDQHDLDAALGQVRIRDYGLFMSSSFKGLGKEYLCEKCGHINSGRAALAHPRGTGWLMCTCNFNMSNVSNYYA